MIFQEKTINHLKQKTTLPDINFKRGMPKLMPSIIEDDENKEFQKSSKKTLGWVLLRDNTVHPSEQKVPAWSSFNQILESEQNFLQANVGYLPPITAPPTQMNVIYKVINRTLSIKKELELSYIFLEVDQAIYGIGCYVLSWKMKTVRYLIK